MDALDSRPLGKRKMDAENDEKVATYIKVRSCLRSPWLIGGTSAEFNVASSELQGFEVLHPGMLEY